MYLVSIKQTTDFYLRKTSSSGKNRLLWFFPFILATAQAWARLTKSPEFRDSSRVGIWVGLGLKTRTQHSNLWVKSRNSRSSSKLMEERGKFTSHIYYYNWVKSWEKSSRNLNLLAICFSKIESSSKTRSQKNSSFELSLPEKNSPIPSDRKWWASSASKLVLLLLVDPPDETYRRRHILQKNCSLNWIITIF